MKSFFIIIGIDGKECSNDRNNIHGKRYAKIDRKFGSNDEIR